MFVTNATNQGSQVLFGLGLRPDLADIRHLLPHAAAAAAGRAPSAVATIYNMGGQIADRDVPKSRDDDGRWIGGSTDQWIDELTSAIVDYDAAAIIYLRLGQPESAIQRWMHEIVLEVRRAIG